MKKRGFEVVSAYEKGRNSATGSGNETCSVVMILRRQWISGYPYLARGLLPVLKGSKRGSSNDCQPSS